MSELTVQPVVDEGLGNTSYLVDLADGRALVVDVSRDLRAVRAAAEHRGLRIAWAADTHLHADFLSGAHDLAAHDGAAVLASAAGGRLFDHTGLADGDEVDLGGLHLRALGTPATQMSTLPSPSTTASNPRRLHRWVTARRGGRPHRPGRLRSGRGARPGSVPLGAAAPRATRRHPGMAHPWHRFILLRARRR